MAIVKVGNLSIDPERKIIYADRKKLTAEETADLNAYMASGYVRKDPKKKTTVNKAYVERWIKQNARDKAEETDWLDAFKADMKKFGWMTARTEFLKMKKEREALLNLIDQYNDTGVKEDKEALKEAIIALGGNSWLPEEKEKEKVAEATEEAEATK